MEQNKKKKDSLPKIWDRRHIIDMCNKVWDCEKFNNNGIIEANIMIVPKGVTILAGLMISEDLKIDSLMKDTLVVPEYVKSGILTLNGAGIVHLGSIVIGCHKVWDYACSHTYLEKVVLLNSVEEIEGYAFAYCNFTKVDIPSSLKEIGIGAFSCGDLREVVINEGVKKIGERAFFKNLINKLVIAGDVTFEKNVFLNAFDENRKLEVFVNEDNTKVKDYIRSECRKNKIEYEFKPLNDELFRCGQMDRMKYDELGLPKPEPKPEPKPKPEPEPSYQPKPSSAIADEVVAELAKNGMTAEKYNRYMEFVFDSIFGKTKMSLSEFYESNEKPIPPVESNNEPIL